MGKLIPFPTQGRVTNKDKIEIFKQLLEGLSKQKKEFKKLNKLNNDAVIAFKNLRREYMVNIFLLENNIEFENEEDLFKIGKFYFSSNNNRWRVKGKEILYHSKGIEDFIDRYYRRDK